MNRNRPVLGTIILLISAFIWGTSFVAQRMATNYMDSVAYNSIRLAIGSVFLFIVILITDFIKKKAHKEVQNWNLETLFGGLILGVCIFFATTIQQVGLETTAAGKSGFITALYIAFVPIIGLLCKKKTPLVGWFAIPIALLGFAMMSIHEDFTIELGDTLTLLCAIIFAQQILLLDTFNKVDPIKITFMEFFVAAIIGLIWMGSAGSTPSPTQMVQCIWPILYVGILSSGVAYLGQTIGQRMVNPALATLLMSLEAVFALIAGGILLHETHSAQEAIGVVIVFIAVMIAEQTPYKKFLSNNLKIRNGQVV